MKGIIGYVYSNGVYIHPITIVNYNGSKVLGRFNNGIIELNLHQIPTHIALRVEFDLYIHDKWTNDVWRMDVNNSGVLVTGFSNFDAVQQSYPNWIGNGSAFNPAGANADNRNLPGACSLADKSNGTTHYKMEQSFSHTDSTFNFSCSDAGSYPHDNCERSWSIDNLKIQLINNQ
jgi:hypothetical protein